MGPFLDAHTDAGMFLTLQTRYAKILRSKKDITFLKVHIVYLMILDYMLSIQFLHLKVTWNDGHVALNRRRLT